MSNSNDFIIENGVLKEYKGNDVYVIVPDGVTKIGKSAFRDRVIFGVCLPDSVITIEDYAFAYVRHLGDITLPDGVTSIGEEAFSLCQELVYIAIPDSVTTIASDAFDYCGELTIYAHEDSYARAYAKRKKIKCSTVKRKKEGDSDFVIEKDTLQEYTGTSLNVTIPDGVKSIGKEAFRVAGHLRQITIPDSVTSIGANAFTFCYGLTSITIPEKVNSIKRGAFSGCYNLADITLPEKLLSIGEEAFRGCNRLTIHAPAGSYAETYAKVNKIPFVAE